MHILLFAIINIFAFLMLVLTKEYENSEEPYWSTGLALFATLLFFSLAWGVMNLNSPYQIFNATSGNIETGYDIYAMDWHWMWMYIGLGTFSFILMWVQLFRGFGWIGEKSEKTPQLLKYKFKR